MKNRHNHHTQKCIYIHTVDSTTFEVIPPTKIIQWIRCWNGMGAPILQNCCWWTKKINPVFLTLCSMPPKEKHLKNSSFWFFHPMDLRNIFRHGAVIGWWWQTAFKHIAWRPSELWVSRNLARWCPKTWETWETLACQTWSQITHRFPRHHATRVLGHDNLVSSSIFKEIHLKACELNIVLRVKSVWNFDESSTLLSKWRP